MPNLRPLSLALGLALASLTSTHAAPAAPAVATAAAKTAPQGVNVSDTWNLKDLYPSVEAWEAERKALAADIPKVKARKGTLGASSQSLLAAMEEMSQLRRRLARLAVYASLENDADTRVAPAAERNQLANLLYNALGEATAFVQPELLAVGEPRIREFLKAEPGLAKFRYSLEVSLRQAPHTLSAEGEDLLAAAAQPLGQPPEIYSTLTNADLPWPTITIKGKKHVLDQEGYVALRTHPDPEVRAQVFKTFWTALKAFERSIGTVYASQLKSTAFQAKARHYPSSMSMILGAYNTPEQVYRTLVAETNAGLPTLHRYFKLMKKTLGLKEMRYSDLYVAMAKAPREYSLSEAASLTLAATQPLGEGYVADLKKGIEGGWMHSAVQRGKRSGAYMNGAAYDVHPYLLMSFSGGYESVSTYAHEWGHAMHTVLANKAQPFETADYALFVAEIPSTFNEVLLAEHVKANAKTKAERIYAISRELDSLRGTFFRQALFAEFELRTHEAMEKGEALTGERFSQIYLDLLRRYHGHDQGVVKVDDLYGVEWAYIPHFYNDFYVFQYATSISAATYFADGVVKGDTAMRDRYFEMLKAGGSADPYEIVKKAGLDMATPTPYRALIARMNRLLDELEALQR